MYFSSHFGHEMAQNADLPISCKNFSGVTPPNPRPVLRHRAVLFPDSHCFGSHNFQIVPARLTMTMITLHYIKIIVRKCKAFQSLYKIELRVQEIKERRPKTNEILI